MGLKKALLSRLRRRDSGAQQGKLLRLAESEPDKAGLIADLVKQSILPREIVLSGTTTTLKILAANGNFLCVRSMCNGVATFNLEFPDPSANVEPLARHLEWFFANSGSLDITFTQIQDLGIIGDGLPATRLQQPRPAQKVGKPAEKTHGHSTPTALLAEVSGHIRLAHIYAFRTVPSNAPPPEAGNRVTCDTFCGINKIYHAFTPMLGKNLLFMIVPSSIPETTFAFALDGVDAVAMDLDRQKTGKIYQAWQQVRSISE